MSVASTFERQMLDLINAERTSRGLDPLTLELRLNEASEDHSVWMDQTRVFSHTGVGGSDPGDRMRDAGFEFSGNWTWGENIAFQSERGAPGISDDVVDLHQALMNSPGHRANILNPDFEVIGIGIEEGAGRGYDAVYVTQNFARTGAPVQLDVGGVTPPTPPSDPLTGSNGNDALVGTSADDLIRGWGGRDTMTGGAGADKLHAGDGHDRVSGEAGNDSIWAGAGDDRGFGGAGNDQLFGMNGDDSIWAGLGNDFVRGDGGADVLRGEGGRDHLIGGAGRDVLDGGDGADRLTGGADGDTFAFSPGRDIVTDFDPRQAGERIDLSSVSSITDFTDLMTGGHIRQVADRAVISDLEGSKMVLLDVSISDLQASDFLF